MVIGRGAHACRGFLMQSLPGPVRNPGCSRVDEARRTRLGDARAITTTILSCGTNAGLRESAMYSSGLPCQLRFPSAMERVRDEAG
jgi:hypothetical protein